jgi:GNAT superfamily N-acetyltransferase
LKKAQPLNWTKENFIISTDKSWLDITYIHDYLSNKSYWAEDIPLDIVRKSIDGSICFGVYNNRQQIGFARVITDKACFAYLADVFIDENYRGLQLSKWLIEVILGYPDLQGLRRFLLATRDAHGLYEQFGFSVLTFPEKWMHIHNPHPYEAKS